jgi:hypothetical protein
MAAVIRNLRLFWKRFTPLEERLFTEVRKVIPIAAQAMFDDQVAGINHVQRLPPGWSEIDFYSRRNWTRVLMFPNTDEFRLAQVKFRIAAKAYKAILSCINGHIFDFAITPGPRDVAFNEWEGEPTTVLLGDPLRSPSGRKDLEAVPVEWQNFLARQSDESLSKWVLYDETSAYRVVINDAQYLILAEREGPQFILQRLEPPDEQLYYLRHHDDTPRPIDSEIHSFMVTVDTTS